MKEYLISYCQDGPDWNRIPWLEVSHAYYQTPPYVRAYAQLAYDHQSLFVHLRMDVPEVRAEERGTIGAPCNDSCLEFFFCPVPGDPRYMNIEFNLNGCMYLGIATSLDDLTRLLPDQAGNPFEPSIDTTTTGWEITYRVPFAFIRRFFPSFQAVGGQSIRANCYACAEQAVPPYFLSWNPVETEQFSFHQSQCFGLMTFSQ